MRVTIDMWTWNKCCNISLIFCFACGSYPSHYYPCIPLPAAPMDEGAKAWKKTEDIPRRFDELPPEPEWVPVADVIRTHREEEARQEAQKIKIKPPRDSDSDPETKAKHENKSKKERRPIQKETRKSAASRKFDDISMPPTVDNVTQSMVEWALNTDYPKKPHKTPPHHKEPNRPLVGQKNPSHLLQEKSLAAKERQHGGRQAKRTSMDGNRSHASPQKRYESRPDRFSTPGGTPSGPKTKSYPSGAARMRTQQSAGSYKQQRPQYDEPTPDYDDENYDAYYSRYDEQYYHERGPDEDDYYYDERGYEDRGAMDPYHYDSTPAYDYAYDERPPYYSQQGYTDPQGDFRYEYDEPQYPYEDQRSGYPHSSPDYGPMPHEDPRGQPHSSYDVLY